MSGTGFADSRRPRRTKGAFRRRLALLTRQAIGESLDEIAVEFDRRFGEPPKATRYCARCDKAAPVLQNCPSCKGPVF